MQYAVIDTAIGPLTVGSTDAGLAALLFGRDIPKGAAVARSADREVVTQLAEYFAGKRTQFDVPLDIEGTPFQKSVWKELLRIPYGETRSYGDIARALGRPHAARAVGRANHTNPIAIVIPCHRVIGRDGSLTGYGGGLPLKERLLAIERQRLTLFT
jgi:methylated-DNA-[protein]-cysteine S-methyltransferase